MNKTQLIKPLLKQWGVLGILYYMFHMVINRIHSPRRIDSLETIQAYFTAKKGLEIGGPSKIFERKGLLPIYYLVRSLDNINFSPETVWTGEIDKSGVYEVENKPLGKQYILDATNLTSIKKNTYDFLVSSNNFEHIANPLKAMSQFSNVLKPGGILMIVLPRKESNFDRQRKTVTFAHLLSDYKSKLKEDDLTHLAEIIKWHDSRLSPLIGSKEDFLNRGKNNFKNRCLHHHVFDLEVTKQIFKYLKFDVLEAFDIYTDYIIIGKKQTKDLK